MKLLIPVVMVSVFFCCDMEKIFFRKQKFTCNDEFSIRDFWKGREFDLKICEDGSKYAKIIYNDGLFSLYEVVSIEQDAPHRFIIKTIYMSETNEEDIFVVQLTDPTRMKFLLHKKEYVLERNSVTGEKQ